MQPQSNPPTRWEAELTDFFATVGREDETYLANLKRQGTFYANTVRPALEAAANALRQHLRTWWASTKTAFTSSCGGSRE